jgi:hypothetical protein
LVPQIKVWTEFNKIPLDIVFMHLFGPPHTPSPKPRMFNVYVESGKKKTLNWFDLVQCNHVVSVDHEEF